MRFVYHQTTTWRRQLPHSYY